MLGFFYEPLMESSVEKKKLVLEELAPMYLRNLEKLVNDNGGYFVGGQVFFLPIYSYLDTFSGVSTNGRLFFTAHVGGHCVCVAD